MTSQGVSVSPLRVPSWTSWFHDTTNGGRSPPYRATRLRIVFHAEAQGRWVGEAVAILLSLRFGATDAHRFTRMAVAELRDRARCLVPPVGDTLCVPGRDCREGLRSGRAFQASLNAGPLLALCDRLRLDVESTFSSFSRSRSADGQSQQWARVETGGWSKLARVPAPWRRTPLHVGGGQGGRQPGDHCVPRMSRPLDAPSV